MCCGPAVIRRRRANMRVDVKTYASLMGWTCAGKNAWWPEGLGRPPGLVESDTFRAPEAGGPGAGVGRDLLIGGSHRTSGHDAKGGPVAAGADWLLGWADAVFGLDVEE